MTLVEILDDAKLLRADPTEVMFWTGAGISHPAPSSLPIGDTMLDIVKKTMMYDGVVSTLERMSGRRLRLEDLFEAAYRVRDVYAYLPHRVFHEARPNAMHYFLAEHLHNNGVVVTMNIDVCIEDAYRSTYGTWLKIAHEPSGFETLSSLSSLHGWLIKPHGSLFHSSMEAYGWTVSNVRKGLHSELKDALANRLADGSIQFIAFCGYSGSDEFDVTPFFTSIRDRINSTVVAVWIKHGRGELEPVDASSIRQGKCILESFADNVCVLEGETWAFFDTLRQFWGYDTTYPAPSSVDLSRFDEFHKSLVVPRLEKARITLECAKILVSGGMNSVFSRRIDSI